MEFISINFGDTAFSRSRDGIATRNLAPAYFEAVVGALAGNLVIAQGKDSERLKQSLSNAFETDDFKEASGPGANSKGKLEKRIQIVLDALLAA